MYMSKNQEIQRLIDQFIKTREEIKSDAYTPEIHPGKEASQDVLQYYSNTQDGRDLLNDSSDSLYSQYLEQLHTISTTLCGREYTDKEKVLNLYEYIRLAGTYEPYFENGDKNAIGDLSQSGLNIALAGKGVCASQAQFMKDSLLYSGVENSTYLPISLLSMWNGDVRDIGHAVVISELDGQDYYLDPTNYIGTSDSLSETYGRGEMIEQESGNELEGYVDQERFSNVSPLQATEEEISKARSSAAQCLIKQYGIDEISKQLGIAECGDLEKQLLILNYIQANTVDQHGLDYDKKTTLINGQEFEISKAWELFCQANDIEYTIDSRTGTIYKTEIDGKEYNLNLEKVIGEDQELTPATFSSEEGLIWRESDEKKSEYKELVEKTKRKVYETMGIELEEQVVQDKVGGAKEIIPVGEQKQEEPQQDIMQNLLLSYDERDITQENLNSGYGILKDSLTKETERTNDEQIMEEEDPHRHELG